MSENFYNKNIECLRKINSGFADRIEKKEYILMQEIEVFSQTSNTGETIFKVVSEGRELYIDGKYNPKAKMEQWFSEQKKFENESVVIIIGFGNAMYLKKLLKQTNNKVVVLVYEPCINIFLKAMEEIDLTDVLSSDKIALVIDGINDEEAKFALDRMIIFDTLNIMHHLVLGNYTELFPEKISRFVKLQKTRVEHVARSYGTTLHFMDVNGMNILNNFRYIYDNYTTFQVKGMLPPDIPSIIVAAGPSLNKNILDLKQAKNKACIIATDTALKPLLNNGIMPDFLVIVDGKKQTILFEHPQISEIPMVMSAVVSREAVNMHMGKKFFSWDGTKYETELIKIARENLNNPETMDLISIPTGGSVATTAFSFANILGSKTIILVGQDLALTGNKTHADGTFKDKMSELDMNSGKYIEVEDVFGGKVLTQPDYKSYLDWFNEKIPKMKDIKVIDATEGGAKITGTEILSLKETIERECTGEINIKELLEKIPPAFSDSKVKEQAKLFFNNTPRRFDDVEEKINSGIECYERIIKLCKRKNFDPKEYVKLSKKVSEIIDFLNYDGIALMLIDSIKTLDYSLRAIAYNTEDNEKDERITVAKHGKVYLEAMKINIKDMREFAEQTVGKVGN